jgi:hypothetical protein
MSRPKTADSNLARCRLEEEKKENGAQGEGVGSVKGVQ